MFEFPFDRIVPQPTVGGWVGGIGALGEVESKGMVGSTCQC